MADFIVTWSPEVQNSLGQTVQYKQASSGTWIDFADVLANTSSYTVTGLLDNTHYQFRISCDCANGDITYSQVYDSIKINCPTVTLTPTISSISYSFPTSSGDITSYQVTLYTNGSAGTPITYSTPFPPTINGSFNSIVAGNIYGVKLKIIAGLLVKECPISNDIIISCTPIVGLGATMSA